jgi:hypothetical protein
LNFLAEKRGSDLAEAAGLILHGRFVQPGAGAADGESLLVQEFADPADQQDFMMLVIAPLPRRLTGFNWVNSCSQ